MKKIVALFFFCSTTFLMGMKKNPDDVFSKLTARYKKFDEEQFGLALKGLFLDEVLRKAVSAESLIGADLKEEGSLGKELYADLDFVPSNPITREDYKSFDITLKFVSKQSESIYKKIREKKEKYFTKLISPKGYFRCHGFIKGSAEIAIAISSVIGASCLYTKIFSNGTKNLSFTGGFIRGCIISMVAGGGGIAIANKIFSPYEKRCETYDKKKQEKEDSEDLESLAYSMYKLANLKAHSLKPIFQNSIRKKENDKLKLLDVKIKTLYLDRAARDKK